MSLTSDRSGGQEAPLATPSLPFDVKKAMIGGVAAELHRIRGGNDLLNWLEAERYVLSLLNRTAGSKTPATAERTALVEPKADHFDQAVSGGGRLSQPSDEPDPFVGRMPRPRFNRSIYRHAA